MSYPFVLAGGIGFTVFPALIIFAVRSWQRKSAQKEKKNKGPKQRSLQQQ